MLQHGVVSGRGPDPLHALGRPPGESAAGLFDSQVWTVWPDGSNAIEVFDSDGCTMGDMGVVGDFLPV